MTEEQDAVNNQLILISGLSGTGKSASLRNIKNQGKWMYLGTEAGKRLPFKNNFQSHRVTDPYQIFEGFDHINENPDDFDGVIIDSLTFLMDMFETQYVINSANTMTAWGAYGQYFKILMQDKVASFGKPVIITAHVKDELDEKAMEMKTFVPIKGALKNNGIEAYFSTVVSTKKLALKDLEPYKSDLLNITEEDEDLGFKYVFQTRPTKTTIGERIRSPMGMFTKQQTFTDNDAATLLEHLHSFYGQ